MGEKSTPFIDEATNTVLVMTQEGVVIQCIERGSLLSGCALNFTSKQSVTIFDLLPDAQAKDVRSHLKRAIRGRLSFCERVRVANREQTYEFMYVPQGIDKILVVARDMANLLGDLQRVRKLAFQDRATGLPNRQFLVEDLGDALQSQALKEGRLGVLSIHIGQIEDFGYGMSGAQLDDVLRQLADRLSVQIRGTNEPLTEDMERVSVVARTDYRQFAVVLPKIENGEDAESVAARIVDTLSEPIMNERGHVYVSPRVGVALFPQDGNDSDTLLSNAEAAMDDARHARSACYRMHSGTIRLRALQRQDLATELRTALQRNDYRLKYLPVIDAQSGQVSCIEALLRWPTTLLTAQPIQKILTVAERTGIVADIGDWVMQQALEDFASWREQGHDSVRIAINLTAPEFGRIDLVERLSHLLEKFAVPAQLVDLEIGEHILVRDAQDNFATCKRLEALGVRVIVEDFGAGTCSAAMLAESPIGGVKIDRRLVSRTADSVAHRGACAGIVALARQLELPVTAVGIEKPLHDTLMRDIDVDQLQGFLFTQPLPAETVVEFLVESQSAQSVAGDAR
ncbi:MAG: phosphodiesterase [Pseudomonadota bacterium]